MISAEMLYPKKKIQVNGYNMAVVDQGDGDPIVFLHGNATSSYMWRNIMPHLEGLGRLIAIDNIGQGDSDKLNNSGAGSYSIAEHQGYFDGAMHELGVRENVALVMHDWGGPLGISWARRHENAIKGLAHSEIVAINHPSYDDYGHLTEIYKRLRGPEGEQLVLEDNAFVEKVFTGGVIREVDEEAMAEIRRPYANRGEDRRVTLSWIRQIPIVGEPPHMVELVALNSAWMSATEIPKLFIRAEPGSIIFDVDLAIMATWQNQTEVSVRGIHHPQEDSPDDIGRALAAWYRDIS